MTNLTFPPIRPTTMTKTPAEIIGDLKALAGEKRVWHVTHLDPLNEKGEYFVVFVVADTKEEAERNSISVKMGGRTLCRRYRIGGD